LEDLVSSLDGPEYIPRVYGSLTGICTSHEVESFFINTCPSAAM